MTTYTPTAEAVEAAARAAALYGRVRQDGLTPEQQVERNWQDEQYRDDALGRARAALAAAGPLIAAETLRDGLGWLRTALAEVTTPSSTPTEPPSLAGEYWRGYRAARDEVLDLLDEPALLDRIARGKGS